MTPAELEDALARVEGRCTAQHQIMVAITAMMPAAQRHDVLALLKTQDEKWEALRKSPGSMRSEAMTEAAEREMEKFTSAVNVFCTLSGR
ncbi:hypothetical protein [Neokomagataea anthophila]|uniref:Uncharacterized protein n=1 Tax=Neokomagataea anthophila TaxID=2826925 RepID=A0ABS5E831_9PROT|nr:hypothetical protein [Neokomagataea anthophila]MBR0560070.1 hypothetical protein [Neokomagataea anthophila]